MTVAAPISHPLGPPTVSGSDLTVDTALKQPTRITRMIMDLTLQKFIVDRVFTSAGAVQGGSVVYDQATLNEIYSGRDVQRVEPGGEFPIITDERQVPKVAEVEKWGGKVYVTDEAKDRNDNVYFANRIRRLANTIIRKVDQRTIAELDASIGASGQTTAGNDWSAVITAGTSASSATEYPAADFAKAKMLADSQELGVVFDLFLLNPQEYMNLAVVYGDRLQAVLAASGISIFVSNRVAAGTAYAVATGQVGEVRVEKALGSETWRDPDHEQTWVQSSVRPVVYVTNPFSILKFTGLAG